MKIPKETLEFFGGEKIRARVFLDKYALRDKRDRILEKTPREMWRRVANAIASTEMQFDRWAKEFYWLLDDFKFIPGGRIHYGAGNNYVKNSLLNCYFLKIEDDSIEGIFDAMKYQARTYSYGGGVGIDISCLRPRGAKVKNSARYSTGAASFMDIFSQVTGTIGQYNRRGALLLSIDCQHPDVEEFITAKSDPERRNVRFANISVKVRDAFMKAVEDDEYWHLWYPEMTDIKYSEDAIDVEDIYECFDYPEETFFHVKGEGFIRVKKVYKTVKARDLWKLIVKTAWESAEPGLLYWDTIKRYSNSEYCHKLLGTNPSLKGDTLVLTNNGVYKIKDLVNRTFLVKNIFNEWVPAICRYTGKKKLYKIVLQGNHEIYATKEHKWPTKYGLKRTEELKAGDFIPIKKRSKLFDSNIGTYDEGFLIGYNLGDGWITIRSDTGETQIGFIINEEDKGSEVEKKIINELRRLGSNAKFNKRSSCYELNTTAKGLASLFKKYGFTNKRDGLPDFVFTEASEEFRKGLIDGLLSADGHIGKTNIILVSAHEKLVKDVAKLLGLYGIRTAISFNKSPKDRKFPNGKIYGKEYKRYALRINHAVDIEHFRRIFKLTNRRKQSLLDAINVDIKRHYNDYWRIKAVEETNEFDDVYDITVMDTTHTFTIPFGVTGNCGEIPLPHGGCCCLGHINLAKIVENPYENPRINWKLLEKLVRLGVRFLDDVLTYNAGKHPIPIQNKVSAAERRIGLGITGLADFLMRMKIRYDSEEALKLVDKVMDFIKNTAYKESAMIAKEKGPFPKFNMKKMLDSEFIKNLKEDTIELIKKYGLRNIAILTVAPVGTGSILAGTTSGIEPLFAKKYLRRSESLSEKKFVMRDPAIKDLVEKYGDNLPDYVVSAYEIDPVMRVKMQAVVQKHVDNSISSTVNLPRDFPMEKLSELYFLGWKLGLKGLTVYREGSREGVLHVAEDDSIHKDVKIATKPQIQQIKR